MGTISVINLGKAYKKYPSRGSRVAEWFDPRGVVRHSYHWVLRDITFSVNAGEAVGIIGINGAGKSTLLKLITGTVAPTTGKVHLNGRVAALLELGMGFHPDFTGRQNAYMAGQLLGYSGDELARLMPAIEEFAEIGEYIDQPVRTYSSGMQMRLAFSVATARRPDILIVDEALSVGDAYFRLKSFERIKDFRRSGTTLLIVSHDTHSIQTICDRAILLSNGQIASEGEPEAVMDYYNALLASHQRQSVRQQKLEDGKIQTVSGTGEATVTSIRLVDSEQNLLEFVEVGQKVILQIEVSVVAPIERLVLGYGIKDRLGRVVYGTNTHHKEQVIYGLNQGNCVKYEICFEAKLGCGTYSVQTALVSSETHLVNNYEWKDLALVFNVINTKQPPFAGCALLDPEILITRS